MVFPLFAWNTRKNLDETLNRLALFTNPQRIQKLSRCYFSTNITLAYSAYYDRGSKKVRSTKVQSCHNCNHYFVHANSKFERHLKHCSGKPGIIYNFNKQSLISYEDNFKSKGDLPFTIYFDFETTAPTDNSFDPEQ